MTQTVTLDSTSTPERLTRHVSILYKRPGTLLKVNIKPTLHLSLEQTKATLEELSGFDFSQAILVRRALQRYCDFIDQMTPEQLKEESSLLLHAYR